MVKKGDCHSKIVTADRYGIGLEVRILTKQLLRTVAQQKGPNQQVHKSYPILQDIEAYSKGRHTHQLSPASLPSVLKIEAVQPVPHF